MSATHHVSDPYFEMVRNGSKTSFIMLMNVPLKTGDNITITNGVHSKTVKMNMVVEMTGVCPYTMLSNAAIEVGFHTLLPTMYSVEDTVKYYVDKYGCDDIIKHGIYLCTVC